MSVLRSQRILTEGAIIPGDIVIEHDYIVALLPHGTAEAAADLGSRLLVPGFVDLHSDAVEKEIEPRPGAAFPMENALVELDKKLAMAGITTMFHAIAFNNDALVGLRGHENAARLIELLYRANKEMLAVDNLIHARFEITSFSSAPILMKFIDMGLIRLLSFMDHSPGQGQFKSLEKWKEFHVPVYELNDGQVAAILDEQRHKRNLCGDVLQELARCAAAGGILMASHDDDTPAKIEQMIELGVAISEFPLCLETARYARSKKMITGMGAPNVVRGRSQSGNISARLLVENDLCDFLCSDYHPSSMLQAVYTIKEQVGTDLATAFDFVSATPAGAAGLDDRGAIAAGKLADIVVIEDQLVPRVVMTFKSGKPIYSSLGCLCTCEHA